MSSAPPTDVLTPPSISAESTQTAAPHPYGLTPEELPNYDNLVIEDGQPVESFFAEKLMRLLTEPLYNCWPGPGGGRTFVVCANVGLFFSDHEPPLAPDVMLSLDVQVGQDLFRKENRSYFIWAMTKPPNVVIEFVSDRRGGEESHKRAAYARLGIPHYIIYDPQNKLGNGVLRTFSLRDGQYEPIPSQWLPAACLGLTLWEGEYEGITRTWLRWCDQAGAVIPTDREHGEQAAEQARQAAERADRLAARLRSLGVDPDA